MARNYKKNTNTTEEVVNKVEAVKEETVAAEVTTDEVVDEQAVKEEEEAPIVAENAEVEISAEENMTNDEIDCDAETSTEDKAETEEVKEEAPKEEKPKMKHKVRYYEEVYGCNWNGQCFDY